MTRSSGRLPIILLAMFSLRQVEIVPFGSGVGQGRREDKRMIGGTWEMLRVRVSVWPSIISRPRKRSKVCCVSSSVAQELTWL
jgi:hypothetical protein